MIRPPPRSPLFPYTTLSRSPAAAPATPIDPATAASISGTVKFEGEAPKAAKIDMSQDPACKGTNVAENVMAAGGRSEEHTSELQSQSNIVCRLLLEKKKKMR